MDKFNFQKGIYRVSASRLNVRGTPSSTNPGNLVGTQLTQGKEFPVYHIHQTSKGEVWGIITPDGNQQAHYVCLWDLNKTYADYVSPFAGTSALVTEAEVKQVLREVIEKLQKLL